MDWDLIVRGYDQTLRRSGFVRVCDQGTDSGPLELYNRTLNAAKGELEMQRVLGSHPHLVAPDDLGLGCCWVKPHPWFAREFELDFMVARLNSGGLSWYIIELQRPDTHLFNIGNPDRGTGRRRGEPSGQLREGIDQIERWRGWLRRTGRDSLSSSYPNLDTTAVGVVVIGRAHKRTLDDNERISELVLSRPNLMIRSYDWLARAERVRLGRGEAVQGPGWSRCGFDHDNGRFIL
ncbi:MULTISPECIES: Shedu anti-phage system protein SduA domain-containing protein [Micromonospora]|uniref:Shedu anti-phage system protein SduA domain-containing protein n=1 Tax=Micromonospora TaxID=1873 RepID=UPI0019A1DC0C|nr:hypothetical protein GCM10012279_14140 [Micromonospora yangpuensis]